MQSHKHPRFHILIQFHAMGNTSDPHRPLHRQSYAMAIRGVCMQLAPCDWCGAYLKCNATPSIFPPLRFCNVAQSQQWISDEDVINVVNRVIRLDLLLLYANV